MFALPDDLVVNGQLFACDSEREAPSMQYRRSTAAVAVMRAHELERVPIEPQGLHSRPCETAQLEHAVLVDRLDLLAVDNERVVGTSRAEGVARRDVERVRVGTGVDDQRNAVKRELIREHVVMGVAAEAVLTHISTADDNLNSSGTQHVESAGRKCCRPRLDGCGELAGSQPRRDPEGPGGLRVDGAVQWTTLSEFGRR